VLRATLDDEAITPVTSRYLARSIAEAESRGAECLVIVLDTPGGLVDSTRTVVRGILRSRVPVVLYVPTGGRAASAGVFLVLASHVAAMAPGSNIGAAHPVQVGGLPISPPGDEGGEQPGSREGEGGGVPGGSVMEEKVVNDTTAWARSLAEHRGRNAAWAEAAVRESRSATAAEARREGVIDLVARDFEDLLAQADGRDVSMPSGNLRLRTAGAEVRDLEMWWGESILALLSNPNLAFLLLIFGFYGILFELSSPGWGVAGTLGAVCLVVAFFALAVLPINYVGLVLIGVAFAMFVAEAFVTSFGTLTLGGIVCLVLGGLMLVDSPAGFLRVSTGIVVPVGIATGLIAALLVGKVVRAQRGRVRTGSEALAGESAVALDDFAEAREGYRGMVRLHGEYWAATSPARIRAGESARVEGRDGLVLRVRPSSRASGNEP
jgi:membrane-bound serine protease (ClpP class)